MRKSILACLVLGLSFVVGCGSDSSGNSGSAAAAVTGPGGYAVFHVAYTRGCGSDAITTASTVVLYSGEGSQMFLDIDSSTYTGGANASGGYHFTNEGETADVQVDGNAIQGTVTKGSSGGYGSSCSSPDRFAGARETDVAPSTK